MDSITTLSELLTAANTQYQVYDLGRRVQHIDPMAFHQIEALQSPYPFPIQGHAQFALVFWDGSNQQYIWFLKLPLDERGLLVPAARSQFIQMLLEAMGENLTRELSEAQQQQMANHPFSFKPSQEKLALFNALVRKQLGQAASVQYEYACQYLSGKVAAENWQHLGLQGLADICARVNELDHSALLQQGLNKGAAEVQIALCQQLEHILLPEPLAETLFQAFKEAAPEHKVYFLRALASHPELCQQAITELNKQQALNIDALVAIAARCWVSLKQDGCRKIYLEALALQEQSFFNQIFADIVAIPGIRTQVLSELRNPHRSDRLSGAIGGLFRATTE